GHPGRRPGLGHPGALPGPARRCRVRPLRDQRLRPPRTAVRAQPQLLALRRLPRHRCRRPRQDHPGRRTGDPAALEAQASGHLDGRRRYRPGDRRQRPHRPCTAAVRVHAQRPAPARRLRPGRFRGAHRPAARAHRRGAGAGARQWLAAGRRCPGGTDRPRPALRQRRDFAVPLAGNRSGREGAAFGLPCPPAWKRVKYRPEGERGHRMAATYRPRPGDPPGAVLAHAALPARVRAILGRVHALAADQLGPWLASTLEALETQLFEEAESARSSTAQAERLDAMRQLRHQRAAFLPRFLGELENSLAGLRAQPAAATPETEEPAPAPALTLVEDNDLDRAIVLREIARRQVQRGGNELLLLAQRFAVLAARPTFDLEQLPLGPHALAQCLRAAGESLALPLDAQLLLYRQFEQHVMDRHGEFAQRLNAVLDQAGVLPGLVYAPYRAPRVAAQQRRTPPAQQPSARQAPATGWHGQGRGMAWGRALAGLPPTAGPATGPVGAPGGMPGEVPAGAGGAGPTAAGGAAGGAQPGDGPRPGMSAAQQAGTAGTSGAAAGDDASGKEVEAAFVAMRQLLAAHREATRPAAAPTAPTVPPVVLPAPVVNQVLGSLQSLPLSRARGQRRRTMDDVREATLARLRQEHGPGAALPPEHEDAFDLLSIL